MCKGMTGGPLLGLGSQEFCVRQTTTVRLDTHSSGDAEWRWRVRRPVRKEVRAGRSHFGCRWCFSGVTGPDHVGSERRHSSDAGGLIPEHSSVSHTWKSWKRNLTGQ